MKSAIKLINCLLKYDFARLDESGNCIIRNTCCIVFDLKRNLG